MELDELKALYVRVMGPFNFEGSGAFTVRIWDGMDGCWTDCPDSTHVSAETALQAWYDKTAGGTKQVSFNEIDYYRIFPADTKMYWDGSEGRELIRS